MDRSTKLFLEVGVSVIIALSILTVVLTVKLSDTNQYNVSEIKDKTEVIFNRVDTIDLKHNFTAEMIYELKVGQDRIDSVVTQNSKDLDSVLYGQKSTQKSLNKIFFTKNK